MQLAIALTTLTFASVVLPALAQDLVSVAPQATKIEYEDARVRVVRLRIPEKGSLPMHDRPARVVVPLTVNDVITTNASGASRNVRTEAGKAAWSGPAKRSVQNPGGPLENIVVELKTADGPAKALTGPPTPLPAGYLDEAFHHWLFENQYVRVYDVHIPPGATTEFHQHAFDSVLVFISGGNVSTQMQGKQWQKAKYEPGSVRFSPDAKQPFTHRVRNEGDADYHVVLIQFLP